MRTGIIFRNQQTRRTISSNVINRVVSMGVGAFHLQNTSSTAWVSVMDLHLLKVLLTCYTYVITPPAGSFAGELKCLGITDLFYGISSEVLHTCFIFDAVTPWLIEAISNICSAVGVHSSELWDSSCHWCSKSTWSLWSVTCCQLSRPSSEEWKCARRGNWRDGTNVGSNQEATRCWITIGLEVSEASKMKQVCRTIWGNAIKEICYPEAFKFTSKATSWGCDHVSVACQQYFEQVKVHHTNSCCGRGVLEVKCTNSHRYNSVYDIARDSSSCLLVSENDACPHLDYNHAYYYRVQAHFRGQDGSFFRYFAWVVSYRR